LRWTSVARRGSQVSPRCLCERADLHRPLVVQNGTAFPDLQRLSQVRRRDQKIGGGFQQAKAESIGAEMLYHRAVKLLP